jgi:hypothetical protein
MSPRVYTFGRNSTAPATVSPSQCDIGWIAGFIEGEGSFCGRRKSHRTETVTVTQVQREPLERMTRLLGGTIHSRPRHHSQPVGQPYYTWQASGARARGVMLTIFSLMSPRRKGQIRKALTGEY